VFSEALAAEVAVVFARELGFERVVSSGRASTGSGSSRNWLKTAS
jgi:hypothetical protein